MGICSDCGIKSARDGFCTCSQCNRKAIERDLRADEKAAEQEDKIQTLTLIAVNSKIKAANIKLDVRTRKRTIDHQMAELARLNSLLGDDGLDLNASIDAIKKRVTPLKTPVRSAAPSAPVPMADLGAIPKPISNPHPRAANEISPSSQGYLGNGKAPARAHPQVPTESPSRASTTRQPTPGHHTYFTDPQFQGELSRHYQPPTHMSSNNNNDDGRPESSTMAIGRRLRKMSLGERAKSLIDDEAEEGEEEDTNMDDEENGKDL